MKKRFITIGPVVGLWTVLLIAGCSSNDPVRPSELKAVFEIPLIEDTRVFFDARSSSHPDGEVNSFIWNFGDGTTCPPDCGTTLGEARPAHEYAEAGAYSVTLEVSRNGGPREYTGRIVRVGDTDLTGPWQHTYPVTIYDRGWCLATAAGEGYILAGARITEVTDSDLFLLKTDATGSQQWSSAHAGPFYDNVFGLLSTSDGGYLLTGSYQIEPGGASNLWIVKTTLAGAVLWTRLYGEDTAPDLGYQVIEVADGYVIAGDTYSYGPGYDAMWLLKVDLEGQQVWSRTFGGDKNDWGKSVARTVDGGFIVAGGTGSFGQSYQMYVVKTDSLGYAEWERTYGGDSYDRAEKIIVLDDGYLLVGGTKSFATSGNDNLYMVKIDPVGNQLWQYAHGSTGNEFAFDALSLPGGDLIVAGGKSVMWDSGGSPGWLLGLTGEGELRWSARIGDPATDNCIHSLISASEETVVLGGYLTPAGSVERQAFLREIELP
jgi:PKD domain